MALAPTPHLEREENIFLRGEQSQRKEMRMANRKLKGMVVRNTNSNSKGKEKDTNRKCGKFTLDQKDAVQ